MRKKIIKLSNVDRRRVIKPILLQVGELGAEKGTSIFQPVRVQSMKGEDVKDEVRRRRRRSCMK